MALTEQDVEAKINTVIQGDYEGEEIIVEKGIVKVGDKEITSQTCEKYEEISEEKDTEETKKKKRGFAAKVIGTVLFPPAAIVTAKSSYEDAHSYGRLLMVTWRNGMESLIFVDETIAKRIKKVFF